MSYKLLKCLFFLKHSKWDLQRPCIVCEGVNSVSKFSVQTVYMQLLNIECHWLKHSTGRQKMNKFILEQIHVCSIHAYVYKAHLCLHNIFNQVRYCVMSAHVIHHDSLVCDTNTCSKFSVQTVCLYGVIESWVSLAKARHR